PNLACEKISAYWKERGAEVYLLLDYDHFKEYTEVYVSKVFTDTPVPKWLKETKKVHIGGTGFFFDKAPNLPDEIEHHMPDYHLYDEWIEKKVVKARENAEANKIEFNEAKFKIQFKEYLEYSIGFITRGCFRKCGFCVNQKYSHVFEHSPLDEFFDKSRKKLCFLDDNFLGCPQWKPLLEKIIATGRPFKFKQGLDERILTREKAELLFNAKYDGDFTFAFDKVSDYNLIEQKLQIINEFALKKSIKFYVLVGYESTDYKDIENAFIRIELLMRYGCLPYIMRFQNKNETPWKDSKYRALYVAIARWCNQPSIIKKMSFRQFCMANQEYKKNKTSICSTLKAMQEFENEYPEIAKKYFDVRMEDIRIR
ncbi:MAG: hypothetical protein PHN56_05010, partial [Candidatus Nanoarchaeia archaeon]|nr:hypothetical protein [Candidatus Nanoarchaeia archaeon]